MKCNWCETKEGIEIGKKRICWDCANMMAKSGELNDVERRYLETRFRKMFGEKE